MNPQKRLGQLEEVMAEMLQKQDRIEDLATKTFGLAETAYTNGETTARAVASLTIETQKAHQQFNKKLDNFGQQFDQKLDESNRQMNQKLDNFGQQFDQKLDGVSQQFDRKLDGVSQQINQELNEVRNDVKEIMNFLREKFS